LSAAVTTSIFLDGSAVSLVHAERSLVVQPDNCWANVTHGEAIRFVVDGREFGWNFDGPSFSFDLRRVAPQGLLAKPLAVYIEIR